MTEPTKDTTTDTNKAAANTTNTTRRDFVKQSAAVGAAVWWMGDSSAVSAPKNPGPAARLQIACIGVGGKGSSDSISAGKEGDVVALCDIDDKSLDKKAQRFPKAQKFNDYRQLFAKMGNKIDAVTVSTPDHTHAVISLKAMSMGKHCFCQKPLTWSIHEAREMRLAAEKYKVATQMGNQGTAETGLREAVDVVKSGAIGDVKEVHIWTNRPIWPQGTPKLKAEKCPPSVKWDLFLGPAPVRPYNHGYHPFNWRGWLDFGTGALGDMACHTANMPVMALDLFDPISVQATHSGIVANQTYPSNSVIDFEFPKRGTLPACKLTWYDGRKRPNANIMKQAAAVLKAHGVGRKKLLSGSWLVGTKGVLYSPGDYGEEYYLLPEASFKDFKKPKLILPRSPGHFKEFIIACNGGKPAMSNFNYAGRLTETILIGNLALRSKKKLLWDSKNLKVTNDKAVNKYVTRDYRKGFELTK